MSSKDLDITLYKEYSADSINAVEIDYSIYDVTTGLETLVGSPKRCPANDATGHYYASVMIPKDANRGLHRIRWAFRENEGGKIHQVVQEFRII